MKTWMIVVAGILASNAASAAGVPPSGEPSPEVLAKGKAAYGVSCASCHGENGDGGTPVSAALSPKPRNFRSEKFKQGDGVEQIFASITKGVAGSAMVAFAPLPEADRWALAYYVKSLQAKDKSPTPKK